MTLVLRSWQGAVALILCLVALASLPLMAADAPAPFGAGAVTVIFLVVASAAVVSFTTLSPPLLATILFVAAHLAVWLLLAGITGNEGKATLAFFLLVAASWLLAWRCVSVLSGIRAKSQAGDTFLRLLIPAIFGAWILILWEAATRGAGIPFIILPPPSSIGARLASSVPILWADVQQTIFKAVLFGYVVGCASGFVVAILADRIAFLRRGLLPIGNLMSALPIIGVAPIMVMWFGFDWQSKAAVVIIMTFFPMLVNTVAGLGASGAMERDLMRSYASDYWQTLIKLRLPAAMPFIFNALKINSTLALIGAIVAEFFGTPIVGMGFRISTEIGRMNVDMVWAEIAVAALIGSVFYGVVALGERATTFWHPSNRGG
ncbi:ABC transporter permease [Neorhizobium galegae]|uniref:ABC transporter permease n=1 Tax=Neorhizobium galegae TaxID=399 RepID=UPI0006211AC8|nr:ABC transporter permease [Neorhizobium galegae]CDZ28239.1 Probable nitrate/sulfonate ABC transporter, permease protein [Neorhizobium galegae bv. officinalis]KAA9388020.1 ABC transporter permease [Neorhizobium galegae]KAB1115518.1 ABC transporter permease [Neorhizobium galegae]MCM2500510.1 ABC transporter permease [Neorhizobium galegae]MCQ1773420.1 ABC transporter permease [Neorhizobium galegae]